MKELKVRLQHRINHSSMWSRLNPILEAGEFGIEEDTGKFKCGDGRHKWNELNYAASRGIATRIFNGYDNEKEGDTAEQVGSQEAGEVFRLSEYPPSEHPAEIIIVPRKYEKGTENEYIMDTPYISLRKNNKWLWVVFSDQKDKALVSSELGSFVLGVSVLG